MGDRVSRPSGQALAAGDVVAELRVPGMRLDELAPAIGRLRVPTRLVERAKRRPELEAGGVVGLARLTAEGDERRLRLLCERGAGDAALHEDQRSGRRVDDLPVELESSPARVDEVELLVLALLVVLVDDAVARLVGGERVHAEGRDAEVVAYRPPRAAAVVDLLDLAQARNGVLAHVNPPGCRSRDEVRG